MEFDPFVFDLVSGSRCGRIITAFIGSLDFGVSSTYDNSCWFSNSMNWKPGLFLLRTMKRAFLLTTFLYVVFFNFKFLVDKFPGVGGDCSDLVISKPNHNNKAKGKGKMFCDNF